ncbi:DNA (cytosine-5)-methyltransferase 1 [Azotobacter beijerinckii]|uniref:DNA (cytosine-5-)-methyltransferase n=1 Tax=Azotobacter beijerinckii TaxID=170623 RepID=A0A1H6UNB5_9GAMM|nr:DNA cytosine methyltransferase [Azotobacter beijerinckii]SEI91247.1 DNA (cytosine-5)-methyltransferase 1 [Azotobacter beijerinckii]
MTAFHTQFGLNFSGKIVVDLFAGGGGASTGIEQALGRPVDVAINHDPDAVSMHTLNHPHARHYLSDVYEVCPHEATGGRPVGLLHASPDCTHHSQARAGQPRSRKIRALAWVVIKWVGSLAKVGRAPRVITLENVEQMLQWGPLVAKRCAKTGHVVKVDGSVATPGERVPVSEQYLVPDTRHRGRNWQHFVGALRSLGYAVQWRTLCAADYGAPTTRTRLFLVARRDGVPIRWPEPTHAAKPKRGQKRWRAAAECIDWSIPCPSIFLSAEDGKAAGVRRPLAEKTMQRLAKGVQKFVINSHNPFIAPDGAFVHLAAMAQNVTGIDPREPLPTVLAGAARFFAVKCEVAPLIAKVNHTGYNQFRGQSVEEPLQTVTSENGYALAVAYLAQQNGGFNETPGHSPTRPMTTITNTGSQQQLVTASLMILRKSCVGRELTEPVPVITAGAEHHALVACTLSPDVEAGALRVAAFLTKYYGQGDGQDLRNPLHTITTKDRLALVTVTVRGTPYVIVDIGMRMLTPAELYAAQGFPSGYIFNRGHGGRIFTKKAQVRFVGNSVSPPPERAVVAAQFAEEMQVTQRLLA